MLPRRHRLYRVVFVVVLAPIVAVTLIAVLLLLGVAPHVVFFAGHQVKSLLAAWGLRAPSSVGVLATVLVWWVIVVMIGLAWERVRHNAVTR